MMQQQYLWCTWSKIAVFGTPSMLLPGGARTFSSGRTLYRQRFRLVSTQAHVTKSVGKCSVTVFRAMSYRDFLPCYRQHGTVPTAIRLGDMPYHDKCRRTSGASSPHCFHGHFRLLARRDGPLLEALHVGVAPEGQGRQVYAAFHTLHGGG